MCTSQFKNKEIFSKGIDEFNSELDWAELIKSIRKLHELIKTVSDSNKLDLTNSSLSKVLKLNSEEKHVIYKVIKYSLYIAL